MAFHIRVVIGAAIASGMLAVFMVNSFNTTQSSRVEVPLPSVASGAQYQLLQDYFLASSQGKRVIYFFAAPWCSTCRAADGEFKTEALSGLPSNVLIVKVDFDSSKELRKKYAVTYQHTFVELTPDGSAKQLWVGGGVKEMNQKLAV